MVSGRELIGALALSVVLAAGPAWAQAQAPARPAPAVAGATAKAFQRDDLQAEANRTEAAIRREAGAGQQRPVPQAMRDADAALQRRDHRAAIANMQAIAAQEPNNSGNWNRLSDTYRIVDTGQNWQERQEFRQRSVGAAYLSYLRARAPQDEARALWFLAEALVAQSRFRQALDALRVSVATSPIPQVTARYEALLADHGFRILDYRVDSDTASPRVCFQFSEALPPRLDAAPFVRMPNGVPGAVTVEDQQVCVDGLRHGERYEIQLRAGLPSVIQGEPLRRAADYQIYVRDRSPAVRFTGRNYVLPRQGQTGIPVVSVNLAEVALRIHRIGDRSIAPTVLDESFLTALDPQAARRIAEGAGAPVWSGVVTVENRLNEEVTTAIPIAEAIGQALRPGVYVMTARRPDLRDIDDGDWEPRATQWFVVSDLGLATALAPDGLHVEARSLANAQPLADVELRLIARNNEVLATARTDAQGLARFEPGLTRGEAGLAPGVLVATKEADYGFLNLAGQAFDLTDRGVAGRAAPGALDAFVTTERGVYRSGEPVNATILLRDTAGGAAPAMPLTLILERPDGVESRRATVEDMGFGGRVWSFQLPPNAPTGTWRVKAQVDPRGRPVGFTSFLVEDFVPERLDMTLETAARALARGQPAAVDVNARWLFGAPAAELQLEGEIIVTARPGPPAGLEGYQVGLADETVAPQRRPIEGLPQTDRDGRARFNLAVPDLPPVSKPVQAEALIRLTEASGRGIERRLSLPIDERRVWIGVKPLFGTAIGEGEAAQFDVAILGADGRPAAGQLRYELSRIERRTQWFRADGRWNFQTVVGARRVADGAVTVAAGQPGRITARVADWGSYRLDVTGADGAVTSVSFSAGYSAGEARADSPDALEVGLDKERYAAGETARVRITARFAGQATLRVIGERAVTTSAVELRAGANTIDLPVAADWGAGAYVVVTAFRPLDAQARRQPGRAIGVRWIGVDPAPRTLTVTLGAPQQITPRSTLRVPVRIEGLAGQEARVTLAAVDLGILNLTGFRSPDPVGHLFGQRALSAELRDLYGFLIDGMQGNAGRLRAGGDAVPELQGTPPAQAPVSMFSGVVQVGADGVAEVPIEVPQFAGTLRLMAVAWSRDKVGAASQDVVARDPIVVTGTLPRFLAAGDRSRFLVEVHNVDGPAGDYRVNLEVTGPVVLPSDALGQTVRLAQGERRSLTIPVTAAGQGRATFDLAVEGPGGARSGQSFQLGLHPATPVIVRRSVRPVPANGSIEISPDLLADVVPGTGAVTLSVGPANALDVPGLIKMLDRYPFGCTEQTVSRAFPLLYLANLVPEADLGLDKPAADTIREAVERVLLRQDAQGSFGLWGIGGTDTWLNAYVGDFLTRARERGHAVPRIAMDLVLDRLRNAVVNLGEGAGDESDALAQAYALYVLARNGRPVIGDLRYLADAKADDLGSPLAKAHVAGALALLGDRTRAGVLFASATQELIDAEETAGRNDFGSRLRDGAAMLALMSEAQADPRQTQRVLAFVAAERQRRRVPSTQEAMWLVLAAQATRAAAERIQLDVGGQARTGLFGRAWRAETLARGPIAVRNTGPDAVQAIVSIVGAPVTPEPPANQGFTVERTYQRLDGTRVDPRQVRQNDRMVVVLRITEEEPQFGRIALEDRLPAGFEIDSPNLLDSARVRGLPAVPEGEEPVRPVMTEFRDDRFAAAWDRRDGQPGVFTVAYIVRAVAPGVYSHPGVVLEDMYNPERFARTAAGSVEVQPAR